MQYHARPQSCVGRSSGTSRVIVALWLVASGVAGVDEPVQPIKPVDEVVLEGG